MSRVCRAQQTVLFNPVFLTPPSETLFREGKVAIGAGSHLPC
jgi:hypothetical protein